MRVWSVAARLARVRWVAFSIAFLLLVPACGDESRLNSSPVPYPRVYAPDGKGYLTAVRQGKPLLHVEGSPYAMGFQHGFLLAEELSWTTSSEFYARLILGVAEIEDEQLQVLLRQLLDDSLLEFAVKGCRENEQHVPGAFLEEMQGIADGARAAGHEEVGYERILLINMAFDLILSFGYPLVMPLLPFLDDWPVHACDGFVAQGQATADGSTLMGRSFMFCAEFGKTAMLMERVPERGNRLVDVSFPGFVGVTVGMNDRGIGIGMDMVPAFDCLPLDFGMGCLLTARQILQETDELSEAVNLIRDSHRGVSWIYGIGDGRGKERGGAVVECSAHSFSVRYLDYQDPPGLPPGLPGQIERRQDLVTFANHYISPEMLPALSIAMKDTLWRYRTITGLALEAYGAIDMARAKDLVDYLHPPNYDYYQGKYVDGSRTVFDLTNLRYCSLYGAWSDPWAEGEL